ncbi:AAA family ATPase [Anaerorhabdus furcosa]|uniref:AAA domain-containing protein, putative AbiEii toxin, Type IV TA system n=1 Tax=Anaerorhabdus furcosa TaxID=118967 RepID=A0A1T4LDQ1_9FIRM|nr:AAA family ATPase [Anaerorhabdus furcosa]SJZ52889.1 AAA domain-containing protein, putative AbiEii toxin, Type IV TA system [Anaerorhabdus furcosa]
MCKELIYIWINQDANGCFHQMGFNFSPIFDISFDITQRVLCISETRDINIFRQNNLLNVTAIIGENGTGKTTLLQYLTSLSNMPFSEAKQRYETWQEHQNALGEFIAVYSEGDTHNIKIINNTVEKISLHGEEIHPYSGDEFRAENYIGNISHIYISNSEYTSNLNMRSEAVDYISLTNGALKPLFSDFFKSIFNAPLGLIADTAFNALQLIFSNKLSSKKIQVLLDLMYQDYICTNKKDLCGKKVDTVSFSIDHILRTIPDEEQQANYTTKFSEKAHINAFHKAACIELRKLSLNNGNEENLVVNLICELVFSYKFQLQGEWLTLEEAFSQCTEYISNITDEGQKSYYLFAIEEIKALSALVAESDRLDNFLPKGDLGRREFFSTGIQKLWRIIKNSIETRKSFVLKYVSVIDLEMSSGERALLNFTSRIYFSSKIEWFMGGNGFKFNENVLLLIDEIDLYLHPEWQRRILRDLINELKQNFEGHSFQIILSSHSPIVLSDIPCKNSIYLKRKNATDPVFQVPHNAQTFGANIHTLYQDAFFIKNGLAMGEYAKQYVNQLLIDVREGRYTGDEAKKRIALIGEPIIRKKLLQVAGQPMPEELPAPERQQMIDFLKRQKLEIERQLEMLERR